MDDSKEPLPALSSQASATSDDTLPPPAFGSTYGNIENDIGGLETSGSVADDGRVSIRITQQTPGLSSLLLPALRSQFDLADTLGPKAPPDVPEGLRRPSGLETSRLPLNIVIHVVGSRGDVQPFVALGQILRDQYHHRVRLATHPVFKDFVEDNGLEFFSIGGDPSKLMAFMVKNPGLMPGFDALRKGEIGERRKEIATMIDGCWRSCIEAGNGMSAEPHAFGSNGSTANEDEPVGESDRLFIADAIIANPPSFAHIHCAEKLAIPLHMMFTMPWTPTQSFPHPLANIQSSSADPNLTNFVSYAIVEMMTWQGLGDLINRFREKTLALESIPLSGAPGMLSRLKIPWTYCWSPALIPKPRDWGAHVSIPGFYFLSLGSNYTPAPDLTAFLEAGPPPVYIGFGSIVVDDPDGMTKLIFEAVRMSGQRALVSKGWGGFGAEEIGIPEGVFMLGNCPHDWLFKRVSCVVHHGGAGTTAAGIACGRPTVVVPFFGDQPFWGAMVARAGAGPRPIPNKELTAERLAAAIAEALNPSSLAKANELSRIIARENGAEDGAASFQRMLDEDKLRCMLCPRRPAVWRIKRTEFRLSALAATVLCNAQLLKFNDLKLYRAVEYHTEDQPSDPITGGASAIISTLSSMTMGTADMPVKALRALGIHPDAARESSRSRERSSERSRPGSASGSSPAAKMPNTDEAADANAQVHKTTGRRRSSSVGVLPDVVATIQPPSQNSLNPTRRRSSSAGDIRPSTPQSIGRSLPNASIATVSTDTEGNEENPQSDGRQSSSSAPKKDDPWQNMDLETAVGISHGIYRISNAGIKSPMDFTLALARGFHNAPRLYHDDTVRPTEKVTDFSSGIKAAANEVRYGFSDGITGLVTQPMEGAKKGGAAGFFKGIGKGVGGLIFKPGAAVWGIPAYTSQGIYRELQRKLWPSVENQIIATRTAQGYAAFRISTAEERQHVIDRWKEMRWYIKKKKSFQEEKSDNLKAKKEELKHQFTTLDRSQSHSQDFDPKPLGRVGTNWSVGSGVYSPPSEKSLKDGILGSGVPSVTVESADESDSAANTDIEEAIKRSIAETSRGDAEQDAAVEHAIRLSLRELELKRAAGADDRELQAAMQRSLEEAQKGQANAPASEESKAVPPSSEDVDVDLQAAIAASKDHHGRQLEESERAAAEEEIVMKHIMKQSLIEEKFMRKRREAGSDTNIKRS